MEIKFVESLPVSKSGRGSTDWESIRKALRGRPGVWALVHPGNGKPQSGRHTLWSMRLGVGFQVAIRNGALYARFIEDAK